MLLFFLLVRISITKLANLQQQQQQQQKIDYIYLELLYIEYILNIFN